MVGVFESLEVGWGGREGGREVEVHGGRKRDVDAESYDDRDD